MSILGTRAEFVYDLNLILQIIIIIILLTGAYYAKRKMQYRIHGKIMGSAIILNALLILLIMAPRLFSSFSFLASTIAQPRSDITILHPIFGITGEILGIALIASLRPCGLKMGPVVKYLMRTTLAVWALSFILGLIVYVSFYIL
jgi:uncharacterized membrane protein YozB (DUF420 family)